MWCLRAKRLWLLTVLVPLLPSSRAVGQDPNAKIDAKVLKATSGGEKAKCWIVFGPKADLSRAYSMRSWIERGRFVYGELKANADATQAETLKLLREMRVDHRSFWIVNTIQVSAGGPELQRIAARPEVEKIVPDRKVQLDPLPGRPQARIADVEWNIAVIRANEVWSAFGDRGEGVVVGTVDTGVEYTHSALINQYRGNLGGGVFDHDYNWFDPTGICGSSPCDNVFHGTHTMGTIVGDDGGDNQIGVAPGARWIAAKGCEYDWCSDYALLSSGEWMLAPTRQGGSDPDPDKRPHVVSNSWGGGGGNDWYLYIVQAWRAAGIFPVFSNGNSGDSCYSAGSPGDYPESYAVGATDYWDSIAWFSSRGPSYFGDIVKPDVSAPGVDVRSSVPGNDYGWASGTSMAAPHVAGTVALILSAAPGLIGELDEIAGIIDRTALDFDAPDCGGEPGNNNVYGEGRIDAFLAVSEAPRIAGTLQGVVTDAVSGAPIALATVSAVRQADSLGRDTKTDGAGAYNLTLAIREDVAPGPEAYEIAASSFGYVASTPVTVEMYQDQTTSQDLVLTPLPMYAISGSVVDDEGNPVDGASVSVLGVPIPPATTDPTGFYEIPGVPEGEYDVEASAGRCNEAQTQHVIIGSDTTLDFLLPARFDAFGYRCRMVAVDWVQGTEDTGLYGSYWAKEIDLPFPFAFYGQDYGSAWVAIAGFLNFLGYADNQYSECLPTPWSPSGAIYPFWDYLYVDSYLGDSIRTATVGTAPDRVWVVEYQAHHGFDGFPLNFEVKLFERSGAIEFLYRDMQGAYASGSNASVGIENAAGTVAFDYSCFEPTLKNGTAIRFIPPPSGTIEGTVTDLNDGLGIPGAKVAAYRTGMQNEVGRFQKQEVVAWDDGGMSTTSYDEATEEYTSVSTTGGDIWDCYDNFEFAYSRLSGDFDVSLAFTDREHSDNCGRWGKFGIMARRSLAPDARFTMIQDHLPDEFGVPDWPRQAGRTVDQVGCGGMYEWFREDLFTAHPACMRLTRRGNVITGWLSDDPGLADGTVDPCDDASWTPVGGDDWASLATSDLYVGFANSEHNTCGWAILTAKFRILCWTATEVVAPSRESFTDVQGVFRMNQLPLGEYRVEASATNYEPASATATLAADGDVATRDFALRAPRAEVSPMAFDIVLPSGETRTRVLQLSNAGSLDLDWLLREGGGRRIAEVPGRGKWLYLASSAATTVAGSNSGQPLAYPSAYRWEPYAVSPNAPRILVYADDYRHYSPNTYVDQALRRLGLAYTAYYNGDFSGFQSALTGQSWDVVIFADENYTPSTSVLDSLNGYVGEGGKLILDTWTVGNNPSHPLWDSLGFDWVSNDGDPPDPVYWWDPSHPAFGEPETVPEFTQLSGGVYGVYGQHVEPHPGFDAIAGYTPSGPSSGQAAIILGNDNRTVFRAFADGQNDADRDGDGIRDGVELWTNLIEGIQIGFPTDVPWLSEDVTSGALRPGDGQPIRVTFDTTGLDPGVYTANLTLLTNGAPAPTIRIPITLVVSSYQRLVNCGGGGYVDTNGDAWRADQKYSKLSAEPWGYLNPLSITSTTKSAIYGTEDDPLYQDLRLDPWEYRFDGLPPGMYQVELKFSELAHTKTNKRIFDVELEGKLHSTLYALDIFNESGRLSVDDHICVVPVTDGQLNLRFVFRGFYDIPIINAIGVTERPDVSFKDDPECSTVAVKDPSTSVTDEVEFRRGDANADGALDMSDPIAILSYLFLGAQEPACMKSADADDSGDVDISDGIYALGYLFLGGSAPRDPFAACGPDPTADPLSCDAHTPCQ